MKYLLSSLLLFLTAFLCAQNGLVTYTTPVSPFSTNRKAILFDGNYIWLSSAASPTNSAGLIRFDGSSFTYYNTANGQLPTTIINSLERDNTGKIWIGTESGLFVYSNNVISAPGFTLANSAVQCLKYSNGNLWVGTKGGLYKYNGANVQSFTKANSGLPSDTITTIDVDASGKLWLGSYKHLISFDGVNTFQTEYSFGTSVNRINDIVVDAADKKWIAVNGNPSTIYIYNTTMQDISSVYDYLGEVKPVGGYQLCKGRNNCIVVPGNKGIIEYNMDGSVKQYQLSGSLISCTAICYDIFSNTYYITPAWGKFYKFDPARYHTVAAPGLGFHCNNSKYLDVNEVKALITNRGDMHWDMATGDAQYNVPKSAGFQYNSSFASAVWFGAYDNSNQLHLAAQTYRQNGHDFWPGPLNQTTGSTDTVMASQYDHLWKIDYRDIDDFILNYNNGNVQNGSYLPAKDIVTYPAKGNNTQAFDMAPFVDRNGNGIYDPLIGGDYPELSGDQMLYSVFNDQLAPHQNTGAKKLGIEIQQTSYAYGCSGIIQSNNELNFTTFYKYKIINRSSNNYHNCNMALFADIDVGCYQDDYIGSNVQGNYAYVYNADNFDGNCGSAGYDNYPPVQSVQVLKGPLAEGDGLDNNNNGIVDEQGEQYLLNFSMYYHSISGFSGTSVVPQVGIDYYHYMNGIFKDSTHLSCGGTGYGGTVPTNFAYTGNSYPNGPCGSLNWIEASIPINEILIISTGNFNLNAGDTLEFEYAYITSFDSSGVVANTLAKNAIDNANVKTFYHQSNKPNCLQNAVGIKEIKRSDDLLQLYPNPATSEITVSYYNPKQNKVHVLEVYNTTGQLVLQDELKTNISKSLNILMLPPGVYIIRLQGENGSIGKRFVKH